MTLFNDFLSSVSVFDVHSWQYHNAVLVAYVYYGWTTDVAWTILTMSLLPFWALSVVVVLLCMQGQKALELHKKFLICVLKMNEGLMALRMSN